MSDSVEVLFEFFTSKEVLKVSKSTLETTIKSKLPPTSSKLYPYDSRLPGTYILQKWNKQWESFVNFEKDCDISNGDRFRVTEFACNEVR